MTPTQTPTWEERFDKEFPFDTLVSAHQDWTYSALKSFIRSLLKEQKEAMIEKVEEKIGWYSGGGNEPIRIALNEVLALLK